MNNIRLYKTLLGPHTTEKSVSAADKYGKVTFKVMRNATKIEIKDVIEKLFKVVVCSVNIIHVQGKTKRFKKKIGKRADWKKAIVSLASGHDINIDEFQIEENK